MNPERFHHRVVDELGSPQRTGMRRWAFAPPCIVTIALQFECDPRVDGVANGASEIRMMEELA